MQTELKKALNCASLYKHSLQTPENAEEGRRLQGGGARPRPDRDRGRRITRQHQALTDVAAENIVLEPGDDTRLHSSLHPQPPLILEPQDCGAGRAPVASSHLLPDRG